MIIINKVRAYSVRVHDDAELSITDSEDKLELKLTNKITGGISKKLYYKLETVFDIREMFKIDAIVYHMHNEIGLNIWDTEGVIHE